MRLYRSVFQAMTISALLLAPVLACAQTPTAAAPGTSLPGKSSVKVDMVPSLFVMNAHGAGLQGQTLTHRLPPRNLLREPVLRAARSQTRCATRSPGSSHCPRNVRRNSTRCSIRRRRQRHCMPGMRRARKVSSPSQLYGGCPQLTECQTSRFMRPRHCGQR
jgi:hypothetical protein